MGVSENRLNPIVPNGFADHYPYEKWLFHWEYTQHFQTKPYQHKGTFLGSSKRLHYDGKIHPFFRGNSTIDQRVTKLK